VFRGFPEPAYMPCPDCGASVARIEASAHECEREQWLDYQIFQRGEDVERVTSEIADYLASARGTFELWCAERERRGEDQREAV
jgi:hypothetical protein